MSLNAWSSGSLLVLFAGLAVAFGLVALMVWGHRRRWDSAVLFNLGIIALFYYFAGSAVVGVYVLSSIEGIILSNGDFLVGMIAGPLSLLAGILTFWFGFKSVVENGSMV